MRVKPEIAGQPDYVSVTIVCEVCSCSPRWLQKLVDNGTVPAPVPDLGFAWKPFFTAWTKYLRQRAEGTKADLTELKKEEKVKTNRLLDLKIAREERLSYTKEEIDRLLLHLSSGISSQLDYFLETEAPPKLDGLSAVQQRPILREMADTIRESMRDVVDKFQRDQ